jgi:4-amino-4-deoxy-L-arabinose transferase-like glycosyltransferase
MERTSTASTSFVRGALWALFATNVYRAATQSITSDEAFTYNHFVRPSLKVTLGIYDANNHILNTLLAKISLIFLPLSEFSLRLPSLLFGGLYLWAVYRLARRAFGSGAFFVAAVALLSLNPLVLDHLSAARGYGMALALWMWALEFLLEYLEQAPGAREGLLNRAGLCLGLAMAANLAFAFPVAALGGAFCLTAVLWKRTSAGTLAQQLAVPAILVAFLLLVLPLSHAEPESFYFGGASLRDTLHSLAVLSLYHTRLVFAYPQAIAGIGFVDPAVCIGLGALVIVAMFASVAALRRREKGRTAGLLLLASGVMALGLALLVAAHIVGGMRYPLNRTGLYFIPIATLAGLALVARAGFLPLRAAAGLFAVVLTAQYLTQFTMRIYGEWSGEAESEPLVQALIRDAGGRPVSIAAGGVEEPVLSFYRDRYRQKNWEPVERGLPDHEFGYYVLTTDEAGLVEKRHLRVIYKDRALTLARSGF